MEARRDRARQRLGSRLAQLGVHKCNDHCVNGDFTSALLDLFDASTWPIDHDQWFSMADVLNTLKCCSGDLCTFYDRCEHDKEIAATFISNAELCGIGVEIENLCQGLCLDCVKKDENMVNKMCPGWGHERYMSVTPERCY